MRILSITLEAASFGAVIFLSLGATGCSQSGFSLDKAKNLGAPTRLDAEQVMLTGDQVQCGVKNDLWEEPTSGADTAGHQSARLLEAGRNLHFDDDVIVSEPGLRQPYVQIRGDFVLQVGDVTIRDEGPNGKVAEGSVSINISHPCFQGPLPLMGVRKGKFVEDASPILQFRQNGDDWTFTKLEH